MINNSPLLKSEARRILEADTALNILRKLKSVKKSVTVAVVDSGADSTHPELVDCIRPTLSVINGHTNDDDDHGTMIAGTIHSCTDIPVTDSTDPAVRILPIKFISQQVYPTAENGAAGIMCALKEGAEVILLPWDCDHDTNSALNNALVAAGAKNVVVVIAAGNESMDNDLYPNCPANYSVMDHVITVMATNITQAVLVRKEDLTNERALFANYGDQSVSIGAPGVSILSTTPHYAGASTFCSYNGSYRYYSGSSPASAYVAGLAALLRAKDPTLTADQVKERITGPTGVAVPVDRELRCASRGLANFRKVLS